MANFYQARQNVYNDVRRGGEGMRKECLRFVPTIGPVAMGTYTNRVFGVVIWRLA